MLFFVCAAFLGASRAQAMPTFAQAYGLSCNACHTQVPGLNSYGRYVQRTMYSSLDAATVRRSFPLWVGETVNYASTNANPQFVAGNVALHAAGAVASDFTYHAQQWLWAANQPGGLDTLWVSYNNLFDRNGHLVIGKMPAPGPSFFGFWPDSSSFMTPELTVGEHPYQLDANRWGAKFSYDRKSYVVEGGWFASGADLNGAGDFSANNDKTAQWRAAYSPANKPLEVGLYGSTGSFPLAEGGVDHYNALAVYAQLDPTKHLPGLIAIYQVGRDNNPGLGLGASSSRAYTAGAYWKVLRKPDALFGIRREMTNDGLGTITQSADVDFSIQPLHHVQVNIESALAQYAKPTWRAYVWWTQPVMSIH